MGVAESAPRPSQASASRLYEIPHDRSVPRLPPESRIIRAEFGAYNRGGMDVVTATEVLYSAERHSFNPRLILFGGGNNQRPPLTSVEKRTLSRDKDVYWGMFSAQKPSGHADHKRHEGQQSVFFNIPSSPFGGATNTPPPPSLFWMHTRDHFWGGRERVNHCVRLFDQKTKQEIATYTILSLKGRERGTLKWIVPVSWEVEVFSLTVLLGIVEQMKQAAQSSSATAGAGAAGGGGGGGGGGC